MKKPICIVSNDWHLKSSNIEIIKSVVFEKVEIAKKLNITALFVLGDIFDSRIAQRLDVLKAFEEVLNMVRDNGLQLIVIPGNHDKTNYAEYYSFLDPFTNHEGLSLIRDVRAEIIENICFTLIPFFREDVWLDRFQYRHIEDGYKNVLLTHVGFEGSKNNDGSYTDTVIKQSLFNEFDLVLSGHYHNTQKIGKNIIHTPSIYQDNFGEDNNKGFTVLYDDLSIEIVKSTFKEYLCIDIDMDKFDKKELPSLITSFKEENKFLRLKFIGAESQIKSIDKEFLIKEGIDVKLINKDVEYKGVSNNIESLKKISYSDLLKEFEEFCSKEGLDVDFGKQFIVK